MSDQDFRIETLFKALADRTRLRLIQLLGDQEVCVCLCVEVLKTSQPKISRHLAYLKRSGLVTARRQGKLTYYRLAQHSDALAVKVISELRQSLATDPQMQHDKARLEQVFDVWTRRAANAEQQSQAAHRTAAANQ